jgi:hypothetical protein
MRFTGTTVLRVQNGKIVEKSVSTTVLQLSRSSAF